MKIERFQMLYDMQLQWMRDLQGTLRSPVMDAFFKAWDFVDSHYFYISVLPFIWYLWDRRIGIRFFYILTLSFILNTFLKILFHQPRPCQVDPSVGLICLTSYGFPSGAAQTATFLCGIVFIECRKWLYRWLALVFAFFLCFSRVYLGVHYPTDILGGVIAGGVLLLMYWKIFPLFEKAWKTAAVAFSFFLLFIGLYLPSPWTFYLFFSTLGVAAGLITYEKRGDQEVKSLATRGWQVCVVIGGLCVLFALGWVLPRLGVVWDFAEGYWLSFLGGWLVQRRKQWK